MILLHTVWQNQQIALWAEQPINSKARKALVVHPGALDSTALKTRLKKQGLNAKGEEGSTVLWLPSDKKYPLPSHPLLGDQNCPSPRLEAWEIPCMEFSPAQIRPWLQQLPTTDLLEPGLLIAPDLRFLAQVMGWATSLVAAQQFLPGLSADRACWEAVFNHSAQERLHNWARGMPAVLYANADHSHGPETVLRQMLNTWVDLQVRAVVPERQSKAESAFDVWMQALNRPNPQLKLSPTDLLPLAESLKQWLRPLEALNKARWRLCLQLIEPQKQQPWQLQGFLQSWEDPSLRLPLATAWKLSAAKAKTFGSTPAQLKELLLLTLGQASNIYPELQKIWVGQTPQSLSLEQKQVWHFLSEVAPLLEQAGFVLLLPSWWTQPASRDLSLRARVETPKLTGKSGLNLASLLQVHWEVALGEESLSLKELETLAKLKQPLVQFRGQWRQFNLEDIQKALAFLKAQPQDYTLQALLPMALGILETPLPISDIAAKGKAQALFAQLQGQANFELTDIPTEFVGQLRPYQVRGVSWLQFLHQWGLGACLADDMGLGKTPQTLARILKARQEAPQSPPVLLICPTTLVANWLREATRFTPGLKMLVHHGAERPKLAEFKRKIAGQDVVISTYGLLHRDAPLLQPIHWQGIVLDEAQGIKNADTRQSKAARSLKAQWRIALTGTPIENHVGDLWSLMDFLNPGLLGSQRSFKTQFQTPIQTGESAKPLKNLKTRIEPFMLRRTKTDKSIISDLPEKIEMELFCPLTREQASLYQAQLNEMKKQLANAEGIQRKGLVLSALMRFKQLCNHPAQFLGEKGPLPGRSGKLQRLLEMLTEIREMNESVLIFSQFAEMGKLLQHYLQDSLAEEVLLLTGQTPKAKRDQMVQRFQTDKGPSIFILSLKAGGTGLNLTRANHVFHYDRWWNPAVENQATDRAFRIGQTRQVQVHKMVCAGTVEERIADILRQKQSLADETVGNGENWLTELSNQQIQALFELNSQEAISE